MAAVKGFHGIIAETKLVTLATTVVKKAAEHNSLIQFALGFSIFMGILCIVFFMIYIAGSRRRLRRLYEPMPEVSPRLPLITRLQHARSTNNNMELQVLDSRTNKSPTVTTK